MFFPNLMHIGANDLVLEIGPGAFPHWRSDCLVDKFTPEDEVDLGQFGGLPQNTKGKPLFFTEDGHLPFKDNSFDYVICSHVLEHVPFEELPLLLSEIKRVAPRAYIEYPAFTYDVLYDFPVHVNLMDLIDGTIVCLPKSRSAMEQVQPFTRIFHHARANYMRGFEPAYPEFFVVGKEFATKDIRWQIMESDAQFLAVVKNRYEKAPLVIRPSKWFYAQNKVKQMLRKLRGEKPKEAFKHLLKDA